MLFVISDEDILLRLIIKLKLNFNELLKLNLAVLN